MFHRPTLFFASSFEKKTVLIIIIALHAVPVRPRALLRTHERRPPSTVRPTSPSIVAVPDDTRASRRAGSRFTASRGSRRLRGARCRARDPNAPDAIAQRDGRGATRLERRQAVGRARATRRIRGKTRYRTASSSAAAETRSRVSPDRSRVTRRLGFREHHRVVGFSSSHAERVPGSASEARSPAGEELSCLDLPPRPSAPSSGTLVSLFDRDPR